MGDLSEVGEMLRRHVQIYGNPSGVNDPKISHFHDLREVILMFEE